MNDKQPDLFPVDLAELVDEAIELLRENCPPQGYYLGFSGGKDSCVIKELCRLSGVKFEARYNATTIDPPELVRFIKTFHPDVVWNRPKQPMMVMVAEAPKVPPTRSGRWCCQIYKEGGGIGRVKVLGVRAAESKPRARRWEEIAKHTDGSKVICPIVYWSDAQVWEFIRTREIPYCDLYDKGFSRLGCVGCPLASRERQDSEFERWPRFEDGWRRAVIRNWEKWHAVPRRDGKPRYHAKFKSGEEFWQWWRNYRPPLGLEPCQGDQLFTNEDL